MDGQGAGKLNRSTAITAGMCSTRIGSMTNGTHSLSRQVDWVGDEDFWVILLPAAPGDLRKHGRATHRRRRRCDLNQVAKLLDEPAPAGLVEVPAHPRRTRQKLSQLGQLQAANLVEPLHRAISTRVLGRGEPT